MRTQTGYKEIDHTADWALQVWAPDFEQLVETAARGMYSLMGILLSPDPCCEVFFQVQADDLEGLLVKFLSELLYYIENRKVGFDTFQLILTPGCLDANLIGKWVIEQRKEIKAVTYHNLVVQNAADGWGTVIVFDV
jgi:SHS2 domain-containing protein